MSSRRLQGRSGTFRYRDWTLAFERRGEGHPVVLIHGLLLPSWINGPVADRLAAHGHEVILFDLLGHGRSDKPVHATAHRLESAGDQVVALLDHLDLEQAVVGGMSLGANVALQVAATAPVRVRGCICEMPVLERGTAGVVLTLFPLLLALRYGGWAVRGVLGGVARLPRTGHEVVDAVLDAAGDPRSMAAVMHGYTTGPVCPPDTARRAITAPTLIIGHTGDWMHPMDDAQALFEELRDARLVPARSLLELRTRPDRLTEAIADFLDEVWVEDARSTEGQPS